MITFTVQDEKQIRQRGSDPQAVAEQFQHFDKGFDFADLQEAATVGNGIVRLDKTEEESLLSHYEELIKGKSLLKFVPASGAASRMFKDAFRFLESTEKTAEIHDFLQTLPHYAFFHDLENAMRHDGLDIAEEISKGNHQLVLSYLLTSQGLDYGNKPKAVLKFHAYDHECRTALEEHLVEAAQYARNSDGVCRLHFTVSEQHLPLFQELVNQVKEIYEHRFGVQYEIGYSAQQAATDTLAATGNNEPFRNHNGQLLFRPGGHGALIENLGGMQADVILIKNIDNVFYDNELEDTIRSKKLLTAYLLTLQEKTFQAMRMLTGHDRLDTDTLGEIVNFAKRELQIRFTSEHPNKEELIRKLNRPIRICGMVRNEGEPGGGPYWVKNSHGDVSLQIVESSQMNHTNEAQENIVKHATHFNPVDLVCGIRDFRGQNFDLQKFVDPETGFISSKTYEGRPLKAMELPGLWNGAMAHWTTLFVEVPLTTFHPVKTLFDLQRKA